MRGRKMERKTMGALQAGDPNVTSSTLEQDPAFQFESIRGRLTECFKGCQRFHPTP